MNEPSIELSRDDRNANKGTNWGKELLRKSLQKYGTGRAIVVDRNGRVIAGNKTLEAALELGLERIDIHTSGDKLVVIVRDDMELGPTGEARELAYWDNRVGEANLSWDWRQIHDDWKTGDEGIRTVIGEAWSSDQREAAFEAWGERAAAWDSAEAAKREYKAELPAEAERAYDAVHRQAETGHAVGTSDARPDYLKVVACPECQHKFVPERVILRDKRTWEREHE